MSLPRCRAPGRPGRTAADTADSIPRVDPGGANRDTARPFPPQAKRWSLVLLATSCLGCGAGGSQPCVPSASATPPGTSSTANAAAAPPLTLDHAAAVPPSTPPEGIVHIKNRSYFLSSAKWPRGSSGSFAIPVCWESGVPDSQERGWVRDAVTQSWQLHSKIVFIGWVNCADSAVGVRITVKDDGANDGPHTQDLAGC